MSLESSLRPLALAGAMAALVALAPRAATAQADGTVVVQMYKRSGEPAGTMTEIRRGRQLRFEGSEPGEDASERGAMILDGERHVLYMLQPASRQYMEITQEDENRFREREKGPLAAMRARQARRNRDDDSGLPKDFKIVKTGRTETVAGIRCAVYDGSGTRNGKLEEGGACIADHDGYAPPNFGNVGPLGSAASGPPQLRPFRQLFEGGKGLMKAWTIRNGKEVLEMQVTRVDHGTPSEALFQPPAGYTPLRMPGMPWIRHRPGH